MSKKRTKKNKKQVIGNLQQHIQLDSLVMERKEKKPVEKTNYFSYDLSLIYKDLLKTLVVTLLVVGALLLIMLYT